MNALPMQMVAEMVLRLRLDFQSQSSLPVMAERPAAPLLVPQDSLPKALQLVVLQQLEAAQAWLPTTMPRQQASD